MPVRPLIPHVGRLAALLLGAAALAAAGARAGEPGEPLELAIEEQLLQDDNPFRLPENPAADAALRQYGAHRSDLRNRLRAQGRATLQLQRQRLALELELAEHDYQRNDFLDHQSHDGRLRWDWQLAQDWSGEFGARQSRQLGGFDNSRVLQRDLIDSREQHARLARALGARWQLVGGWRQRELEHGLAERRQDDQQLRGWQAGVEYQTPAGTRLALQQRQADTRFDRGPDGRDYRDQWRELSLDWAPGARTDLEARAGWQSRDYPTGARGDFAGATGRLTLGWEATAKTRLELGAWRELQAYQEAESDYFVATGQRLALRWRASDKLELSGALGRARHQFEAGAPLPAAGTRRDRLATGELELRYALHRHLHGLLGLNRERRDSSREDFDFTRNSALLGLEYRY